MTVEQEARRRAARLYRSDPYRAGREREFARKLYRDTYEFLRAMLGAFADDPAHPITTGTDDDYDPAFVRECERQTAQDREQDAIHGHAMQAVKWEQR